MNDVLWEGTPTYVVCQSCRAQVPITLRATSASTKGFVARVATVDVDPNGHRVRVDHASTKFVRFVVDPKSCTFRGSAK